MTYAEKVAHLHITGQFHVTINHHSQDKISLVAIMIQNNLFLHCILQISMSRCNLSRDIHLWIHKSTIHWVEKSKVRDAKFLKIYQIFNNFISIFRAEIIAYIVAISHLSDLIKRLVDIAMYPFCLWVLRHVVAAPLLYPNPGICGMLQYIEEKIIHKKTTRHTKDYRKQHPSWMEVSLTGFLYEILFPASGTMGEYCWCVFMMRILNNPR